MKSGRSLRNGPIVLLALCLFLDSGGAVAQKLYADRNGGAEAKADIAAAVPPKLYYSVRNGRASRLIIPGLADCDPIINGAVGSLFVHLPAADWAEGVSYTQSQQSEIWAATRFVASYNRAIFRARQSEIKKCCPTAKLQNLG